jgi:RNA polymerase sigma factor (sigma-70 family)
MAGEPLGSLLYHLRRCAARGEQGASADGQLLEAFVRERDPLAFSALLERHGPMVLGVCRRILRHPHDAEDAFQATFLILARKAHAIRRRPSVGSWLHGVALRVARRIRAGRPTTGQEVPEPVSHEGPATEAARREVRALIDEELARLPEKYRAPLVLCYLEGCTNDQAARELGWTRGVVAGRLSRARDLLRGRLTRRGVGPAALLGALLAEDLARAVPRATLVVSTVDAAARFVVGAAAASSVPVTLAEGVLRTMFLSKLKMAATVVLSVALVGSAFSFGGRGAGGGGAKALAGAAPVPAPKKQGADPKEVARLKQEIARLQAQLEQAKAEADAQRAVAVAQRDRALQAAEQEQKARRQAEEALRAAKVARLQAEVARARAEALLKKAKQGKKPTARVRKLLGERGAEILSRANTVEVWYMGTKSAPKGGGGFPVVTLVEGKAQPKPFADRLRAVLLDEKSYRAGEVREGTNPAVGFRLRDGEDRLEVVLSFTGNRLSAVTWHGKGKRLSSGQADFGPARAALVRLAKEAFPKDKKIQSLTEKR